MVRVKVTGVEWCVNFLFNVKSHGHHGPLKSKVTETTEITLRNKDVVLQRPREVRFDKRYISGRDLFI